MSQHMVSNSLESRKDSLEFELNELLEAKHMVEGEIFQKYFATPLYQEKKKLKDAYDCKDMEELRYNGGKKDGLNEFFAQVDRIETKIKFIRHDLDNI